MIPWDYYVRRIGLYVAATISAYNAYLGRWNQSYFGLALAVCFIALIWTEGEPE